MSTPTEHSPVRFQQLAELAQDVLETRGTNAKIARVSKFLKVIGSQDDIRLTAQFLGEGAFPDVSGKRASVGHRTTSTAAAEFADIDYDRVFKPCRTATGSASETIEKLFRNLPEARSRWKAGGLTLKQVSDIYESLFKARKKDEKQRILFEAWEQMTPTEVKFFIRIMGGGSLRIGFETKSVVNAIAKAFGYELEKVRYAHMITGSLGETAVLAKQDRLGEASFSLFHPLSFMLASPIESRAVEDLTNYVAEEKFDGMRAQVHISGSKVELYSRDLNEITGSFPEIVAFFRQREVPELVLDGEICVFRDNTILPFQLLQKRMGVKKPGKKLLEQYPVLFIAYDVLFMDGDPVFDKTLTDRREMLQAVCDRYQIPLSTQQDVRDHDHIEVLFRQALAHGNEGLMLKHRNSSYEYGQRRKSWLKVKKPSGSLDTVILYAHAGSGKRGGTYSDFTLGISVRDDERYEEEFIPIGKAYGGYTNEELDLLNNRIKDLTLERFGPTLLLKPEIIVELEFEDIQVNKRTKANYTLRLPRFKAIRWDLSLKDVDTLKEVEIQFQEKLDEERESQNVNPSFEWEQ